MPPIEVEFAAFVAHLREQGVNDFCRVLAHMERADVPEQYQDSFDFWSELSGQGRNLMLDVACGRRLRKKS